jgi:hypothetical protein
MHAAVRKQYKAFLWLGRDHPTFSTQKVREKVKTAFLANATLEAGTPDFKRALARGRYELGELEALIHIHKYRAMKQRYELDQSS